MPTVNLDGAARFADALERLMEPLALATRQINAAPTLYALATRLLAWYDTHCDPSRPAGEHAHCEMRALVDDARGVVERVEGA